MRLGQIMREAVPACRAKRTERMVRQELEGLEAELGAAVQAGQADAFVHYLHGLALSDRRGPSAYPYLRPRPAVLASCLFHSCLETRM